ncbi:hypothetical protein AYO45_02390 [Gammaproteobacteria bacterium SCGC AG-212-F23]|nr:hypothetical protein AYO45_02390 [Gammaproteobacteria bacterium SCGC AG-212-F23]
MQKINLLKKTFFLISSILTVACASSSSNIDTMSEQSLADMRNTPDKYKLLSTEISDIRYKALKDTAMSIGAQGGLAWASREIDKRLEKDKWFLETIYNFNGMMLSHGVLPPVLQEGDNSLNLADPNTIRIADKTYRILQQARFATTPPNWRDYIWLNYSKPDLPANFLLPRTNDESKIWKKGVAQGWDKGIQQAYSIFQQNLARLKRDYAGMILYRKLLQQNMVSAPCVSTTELGVTGDGSDMRVNDQVLRIVELPKLQTDTKNWQAVVVKNNDH